MSIDQQPKSRNKAQVSMFPYIAYTIPTMDNKEVNFEMSWDSQAGQRLVNSTKETAEKAGIQGVLNLV